MQKTKTKTKQARKRILSITVRRMVDDSPDTSLLGSYDSRAANEFAIDRAHSEDCASIDPRNDEGMEWLRRIEEHFKTNFVEQTGEEKSCLEILSSCFDSMECDCGFSGHWDAREYRYFNPNYQNYAGLPEEGIRKYCRQDFDRMESLNSGQWCYIGIRAEAEVQTGSSVVQRISSGGLFGIESDSGREHIEETIREELASLKSELLSLGFGKRAIASAFKPENIREKNE